MKETGYIYIIKNYKNNKVYIGQTTQDVEKRFNQHLKCSKSNKNQLIYFYQVLHYAQTLNYII